MTHGANDYSNITKSGLTYRLDDMGELASRLGSPVNFDRRGDVIYVDDFRNGLGGFDYGSSGLDSKYSLISEGVHMPPYAVRLYPGAGLTDSVSMYKNIAMSNQSYVGFEFSFRTANNYNNLLIKLYHYNTDQTYIILLEIDLDTGDIYYYTDTSTKVKYTFTLPYNSFDQQYNTIKIVMDCVNNLGVRLIYNDTEYDISSEPLGIASSQVWEGLLVAIILENDTVNLNYINIDKVIITTNE